MTHPSPSGDTSEWELMRRHFSDERLRLYLNATNGDEDAATRFYQWNSRCSAAFWEALGYLEVSLRNALDARMLLRQRKQGQARHWVFDDARQLGRDARGVGRHAHPYQDIAIAIRRVQANGKPLDLDARWDDLITLTGWLDPELGAWIETNTDVPAALSLRP